MVPFSATDDDFMTTLPLFPETFTVTQITTTIRQMFDQNEVLQDLRIEGEISNLTRAPSGHIYFTLKDANAQLRVVMWRSNAERLSFDPRHGERIVASGSISVYEVRGEYQLYASTLQRVGEGDLHQQFELLKARLAAEGLFDAERKRPLPFFPRRIGVVTSAKAAAFQDVLNVLRRRFPVAEVLLSPTLVQGNEAPPRIMAALERLYKHDDIDVILLVRGGGSLEDLWCFNDEAVVRKVVEAPVPIVVGVGHEIDFTLVDFAADHRAPTPSAAAELVTPEATALHETVRWLQQRAVAAVLEQIQVGYQDLGTLRRALRHLSPQNDIINWRQRIDDLTLRLQRGVKGRVVTERRQLAATSAALQSANPLTILARGYAIVRRVDDEQRLSNADEVSSGTKLDIQLHQGHLRATVDDD